MEPETINHEYRLRLILVILIAAFLSIIYLMTSMEKGRLAQDVTYDDVGYFNDAAVRLKAGLEGGFYEFLRTFVANPPHSPFSTAFAILGFFIGGLNDLAPYAANGIILILVGWFIAKLFRHEDRIPFSWIIATTLVSPLMFRAIHDFRPDIFLGLITAATVWLFGLRLVLGSRSTVLPGVLLGACLLVKPTFFAHTIAIAIFLVVATGFLRVLWSPFPKGGLSFLTRFLLIGAVTAMPYYALNAAYIFRYFWENTQGTESAIWSFEATVSFLKVLKILLFDRGYGWQVLGYHLYLCIILLLVALFLLAKRRETPKLIFVGLVLGTALLSLFVLVVGRHKNEFFLSTFQSTILLLGLFSFSQIVSICSPSPPLRIFVYISTSVALVIVTILNVGLNHWQVSEDAKKFNSWNDRLVTTVLNDSQSRLGDAARKSTLRVFFSFAGPVSAESVRWIALKKNASLDPFDRHRSSSVDEHLGAAVSAHYIIVPNEGLSDYYRWLPSSLIQRVFLDSIIKNSDFRQIEPSGHLNRYFVFVNKRLLDRYSGSGNLGN